jgi:hypothetical protein
MFIYGSILPGIPVTYPYPPPPGETLHATSLQPDLPLKGRGEITRGARDRKPCPSPPQFSYMDDPMMIRA